MILLLPLLSAFLFSGCIGSAIVIPVTINPDQVYLGYPCRDQCEDFKSGYEAAKASMLESTTKCVSKNDAERLGCQAYVTDYRYATTEDKELIQAIETELNRQ
jgi:hypothetical protein